jgi:6-pyruvoyltetrahydropterin/6-carboxytetrahydropterin synthase
MAHCLSLPEITLTKKGAFAAAHFYWHPDWDAAKNLAVFDLCSNRAGHGHNYKVEVSVSGPIAPETGMVVNLKDIKAVMAQVLGTLEHKNLNHQVAWFQNRIPTLENISLYLWQHLSQGLVGQPYCLKALKVIEQDDLYVEYFGGATPPDDARMLA